MQIILCAAEFDAATKHSYDWAEEIYNYANAKLGEDSVLFLPKELATREQVEEWLTVFPDQIFVHYDHGNEDCLWGQNEIVIDLDNNNLLKNRECYTMSCLSAKVLGIDSYHRYGTTFWGSYKEIVFTTDALAEFKEAMNFGIKMWIDGEKDWNKIMEATQENDDKIIDQLIADGKIFAASLLNENSEARRIYTAQSPPPDQTSECWFRRQALKLFGQKAWRIRKPWR